MDARSTRVAERLETPMLIAAALTLPMVAITESHPGGWLETTDISIYDFLQKYIDHGVQQVFCTDVSKDGLLAGPSVDLYKKIIERFPSLHFIASGGVSSMQDLESLADIGCTGAIVGKAIYENRISLEDLKKFSS